MATTEHRGDDFHEKLGVFAKTCIGYNPQDQLDRARFAGGASIHPFLQVYRESRATSGKARWNAGNPGSAISSRSFFRAKDLALS